MMVFMAETLKRPLWVAPGTIVNGVRQYGTPVSYRWGWHHTNTDVDMKAFGPQYVDYRRAIVPNSAVDNIKVFDRAWLESEPADLTDPLASDADFFISSIERGAGGTARVMFKRLSPDAG
jgi:hypothetical protein